MRIVNRSPYDTHHLRRTALAAVRSLEWGKWVPPWWKSLKIHVVLSGAKVPKLNWGPGFGQVHVRVPKLTGDEWHQIARDTTDGRALTTEAFANLIRAQFANGTQSWRVPESFLRKFRKVVPLRVTNPAPKLDLLQERHARAVELERSWLRKQKLAATKVKLYRRKTVYYEKRLAARKEDT